MPQNPYDAPVSVAEEPGDEADPPIYQCLAKGIRGAGDPLRYGGKWTTSRRASLKVYPDRLVCGDWVLPYGDFQQARLIEFRAGLLRRRGKLLTIKSQQDTFHFGLMAADYWDGELPFEVERGSAALRHSPVSLLFRALIVIGLLLMAHSLFRGCQAPSG